MVALSGEEGTGDLITHAAEIGVGMLVVLGLAKLFAATLLLATGWKGGYIFPIMFASVALGLACEPHLSRHSGGGHRCSDDGGGTGRSAVNSGCQISTIPV